VIAVAVEGGGNAAVCGRLLLLCVRGLPSVAPPRGEHELRRSGIDVRARRRRTARLATRVVCTLALGRRGFRVSLRPRH
jgi:hypothetical protein